MTGVLRLRPEDGAASRGRGDAGRIGGADQQRVRGQHLPPQHGRQAHAQGQPDARRHGKGTFKVQTK